MSFEQIVDAIAHGKLVDVRVHPNRARYPNQLLLVVEIDRYIYLVPMVEDKAGYFLKTIIPSRKATREVFGG